MACYIFFSDIRDIYKDFIQLIVTNRIAIPQQMRTKVKLLFIFKLVRPKYAVNMIVKTLLG